MCRAETLNRFNSYEVRLKEKSRIFPTPPSSRFNSYEVRLKEALFDYCHDEVILFQFL